MPAHRSGHLRRDATKRPGPQRVAVLGGGPAGLAAAYTLAHADVEVEVYEAAPARRRPRSVVRPLGLARRRRFAHLRRRATARRRALRCQRRQRRAPSSAAARHPRRRAGATRIRCNARNSRSAHPRRPCSAARRSTRRTTSRTAPSCRRRNTQEYMVGRFGKTLSETFFRSYVEKLYGRPWNEIDPEFARGAHHLDRAHARARRSRTRRTAPARSVTASPHRSSPQVGTSARTARRSASRCTRGPTIESNGTVERYDHVISTLPLSVPRACASRTSRAPVPRPRHVSPRGARCSCTSTSAAASASPSSGASSTTRGIRMGRVANVARWWPAASKRPAPPDRTVLCAEFWCTRDDATWARAGRHGRVGLRTGAARQRRSSPPTRGRRPPHPPRREHAPGTGGRLDPAPSGTCGDYFANFAVLDVVGRHAVHGTSDVADNLQAGAESARSRDGRAAPIVT